MLNWRDKECGVCQDSSMIGSRSYFWTCDFCEETSSLYTFEMATRLFEIHANKRSHKALVRSPTRVAGPAM